jgi:hypothetical protein
MTVTWDEISAAEWVAFASAAGPAALQQGWAYGEALRGGGAIVHRLAFRGGGGVLEGVAQLVVRRFLGFLPVAFLLRGPLGRIAPARVVGAFRERFPHAFLLWTPVADPGGALGRPVVTGYATAWLEIGRPDQALLAGMDVRWRHRVHRVLRSGLATRIDRDGSMERFLLSRELEQRRRIGYRGPHPLFLDRLRAVAPADRLVMLAFAGDDPVAGVLLQRHGSSATYQIGWTGPRGRDLDANRLLLWQSFGVLRGMGVRWLDLGGIATDKAPGPTRFKLQTGAVPEILPGTFLIPPRLPILGVRRPMLEPA